MNPRSLAGVTAAAVATLGCLVLVGWAFDTAVLKSVLPGWVSMKPNTALAFVLLGLALWLQRNPQASALDPQLLRLRPARFCALLAGLIGLLTLSEYVFGWDPGIDQWLFREPSGATGTSHPGRMAPDTALCFVLLAAGLTIARVSRPTKATLVASAILGSLVMTVALAAILGYSTLALRTQGWWGLTIMAPPTAAVLGVLGGAIVLGSWRDALGPKLSQFSSHLWWLLGCAGALAVAFALYARSEQQIARTNELRHRSFLLADELRQSGDDLTRMARTYVVTGDPVYKQHFQDILDIRDGKKPRPENYARPYWDLVLGDGPAPRASQQAVPLLDLMRQARFTEEEFRKLAEAKANSDGLTIPEFEAMKLAESTGPEAEANRAKARMMMYDAAYHRAKAAVMGPIHDFSVLVDERTLAAVRAAENSATIFRYVCAAFGLGLMFVLWRTYVALCDTLGGSVDEVYAHIATIGSGEFSTPIQVRGGLENSVLGWLSETQVKLSDIDRERRQAEDALRASEEQLQLVTDHAPVCIARCDHEQRYEFVNQPYAKMFELCPADIVGRHPREVLGEEAYANASPHMAAALAGQPIEYDLVLPATPDGPRAVHVSYAPDRDASGRVVGFIAAILDITERKQAEEALAIRVRVASIFLAIADDEMFNEVLKIVLDVMASPFGVFGYLDEAGNLVVPTMTRQIWDKCQVPDKTILFPRATWGDSSWPRAIREKRTIHSNEPSGSVPEGHVGIRRHISLPILFQGEVIGLFQVANRETDYAEADISTLEAIATQVAPLLSARLRRERAQEALHKLNAELEQRVQDRTAKLEAANQELEAFSYSVSHDLRAPLRAIDGYGRILAEDYESRLDPEGRRVLGVISSETQRMGQLVDDLLAFSRLGRQKLESSDINMAAMAQAVFGEQAAQSPKRALQLELKPLLPAHGDRAMIRVVLRNLLSNAIKFTKPRNPALIEVGSRQEDGQAVYHVKDNGVGFDMKYAHKLFGVFQRLHSTEEFEGTGVGLALVQRVIHRHGGRVWAEGRVNQGATFYFSLPNMKEEL
jgi:PAS domain S-box-containing protein